MSKEPLAAVSLRDAPAFATGRYRRVYVHPADSSKCIKIDHNENLEKGSSLLAPFRTVAGGNAREAAEYRRLTQLGVDYERYFPPFYGAVNTDLGEGLCVGLLRGTDGALPVAIRDILRALTPNDRQYEFREFFYEEYRKFADFCERHLIMSVSNNFENLGIIQMNGVSKLVSFDLKAISSKQLIPLTRFSSRLLKKRIRRRFAVHIERLESWWPHDGIV